MIKRTLFFASPAYIHQRNEQLVVKSDDDDERTVPIEDIGVVILESPRITVTLPVLQKLNANNVAVILCNNQHHPNAMLLNLDSNHLQGELFNHQINANKPLQKHLWKQIIESKIKNQAALLTRLGKPQGLLPKYAKDVRSDDQTNREGVAAREYWKRLMGKDFTRDRYGDPPNNLLNYGYTILRAAVARAIAGSGLLATLGIHHHNRYNAFCLADDIMEPYRPFVDEVIYDIWESGDHNIILTKDIKTHLLQVLTCDVMIGKNKRPIMIALSITTSSLAKCYSEKQRTIICPKFTKK